MTKISHDVAGVPVVERRERLNKLNSDDVRLFEPRFDQVRMDEIKSRMVLEDHTYMVNGRPLVLYRIGVLASMLGRESVTMRKLERLGYIPKTPYTLKHEKRLGAIRLYSEEMILGLVNLAREEKILIQYGIPIYKTRFRERAKELFDQLLINQSGDVDLTGQAA